MSLARARWRSGEVHKTRGGILLLEYLVDKHLRAGTLSTVRAQQILAGLRTHGSRLFSREQMVFLAEFSEAPYGGPILRPGHPAQQVGPPVAQMLQKCQAEVERTTAVPPWPPAAERGRG